MFGSIKNQLRSVIEWKNPSTDVIFEKWSSSQDEIKNASKLIVGPGQGCLFIYEGKVQAVYTTEGMVELTTANIPFWTTITKFMQAFESEHKVGIYFFRRHQLTDLGWGTTSVIKYDDPKYKFPVGLRAFGNFSVQITQAEWFVQNITGVKDQYTASELRQLLASRFLQPLTDYLANAKYSYAEIDSHRTDIAQTLKTNLDADFSKLGFSLLDFRIEGTSFDDETAKRINRIADMSAESLAAQATGLSYAQFQQLEALKEAAKNPGGSAGMGMGVGVGLGFGQQMVGAMAGLNNNSANANSAAGGDDVAVRLKKLKELLDQNLISNEEFETKRKEILSKI
ncbi:MAG: SPFH domain-containing protein [Bdellovibrio sp.]|nr:SPFH domain-containing protein [Bdellovibrio sp.]